MPARRVVVTGAGVLSPVGNDRETFFSTLMAGKSGIRRLESAFVDALDMDGHGWGGVPVGTGPRGVNGPVPGRSEGDRCEQTIE